jgi:hypothetical protein
MALALDGLEARAFERDRYPEVPAESLLRVAREPTRLSACGEEERVHVRVRESKRKQTSTRALFVEHTRCAPTGRDARRDDLRGDEAHHDVVPERVLSAHAGMSTHARSSCFESGVGSNRSPSLARVRRAQQLSAETHADSRPAQYAAP